MFEIFTQMWTFNRIFAFSHTSIKNSTEVNKEQGGGKREVCKNFSTVFITDRNRSML